MVLIIINNIKLNVKKNITVLDACNILNINIPRFCYHKNLEIAGNCRMCLVEIKNILKPVASCAMPVSENMEIFTNSPKVKKARENILEFLLINHPLDCPICDQGGECDLQDQTLIYGSDRSRFFNLKRSVEDKNFGPFIKTIMTRCIHCTRCVRFASEVCNIDNLGTTGRGNKTEISFYISNIFNSEYSGNVIDLCPVGALTSKPFSFKARSWELKKIKTIDILDSIGLNLIINTFNNNIVRILPQNNWIPNKTRFFFDSLVYQRIEKPLLKINNKTFKKISWKKAFFLIKKKIKNTDSSQSNAVIGNLLDLKTLFEIKKILNYSGINNINYLYFKDKKLNNLNSNITNNFIYNDLFIKLSKSNLCILVDLNPLYEGSYLNLFLNNCIKRNNLKVISIGNNLNNTINLGLSKKTLSSILEGKHFICKKLLLSKNPIIIYGKDNYLLNNYKSYIKCKNISNFILETGFLNFLEIYSSYKNKNIQNKLMFLYNTDKYLNLNHEINKSFIIYQGHHFTKDSQYSNLILPLPTFLEKKGLFLNIEGNIQIANKAIQTNSNTSIYKNLFFYLYNSVNINKFNNIHLYFKSKKLYNLYKVNTLHKKKYFFSTTSYKTLINNFYMSNILENTSKILMKSLNSKKVKNI